MADIGRERPPVILGVALLSFALGTGQTSEVFIDLGACPGECCQYGEWTARPDVVLYDEPGTSARSIGVLRAGERATALTGEVHTVPGSFRVHRNHQRYRPGDVITVYTYLGEGFFRIAFDGELYEEELGFSPWGGLPDSRCSDHPSCFGELDEELESTWWAQLEFANGSHAWVRDPGAHFDGTDACG